MTFHAAAHIEDVRKSSLSSSNSLILRKYQQHLLQIIAVVTFLLTYVTTLTLPITHTSAYAQSNLVRHHIENYDGNTEHGGDVTPMPNATAFRYAGCKTAPYTTQILKQDKVPETEIYLVKGKGKNCHRNKNSLPFKQNISSHLSSEVFFSKANQ